jgi:hypothetical protein
MQVRSYVTPDGSHDPETYAMMAVDQIVQIEPSATGPRMLAARRFETAILDDLAAVFRDVVDKERGKLAKNPERTAQDPTQTGKDFEVFLKRLHEIVLGRAGEFGFGDHFETDGRKDVLRDTLARHLRTAQHVERAWAAHLNPDAEESRVFKATFHGPAPSQAEQDAEPPPEPKKK